jgi:hypothetical protein
VALIKSEVRMVNLLFRSGERCLGFGLAQLLIRLPVKGSVLKVLQKGKGSW